MVRSIDPLPEPPLIPVTIQPCCRLKTHKSNSCSTHIIKDKKCDSMYQATQHIYLNIITEIDLIKQPIEFFNLKPVNEFSEFLSDTCRMITMCTDVMDHPCEITTHGKSFFILVVKIMHVGLDSLTM